MVRLVIVLILLPSFSFCQEDGLDQETIRQLESLAETTEEDMEDLSLDEYRYFLKHPVDLNEAGEDQLKAFNLLSPLQVSNLLAYRKLLGKLIHVYELQAIPAWDLVTIRKILPLVKIGKESTSLIEAATGGNHHMMIRYGNSLEKSRGIIEKKYQGSQFKIGLRYRYQLKDKISWGWTAEKDSGEPFFKAAQKAGFDFYSFHLFLRRYHGLETLALGDFTLSMGQGLIHWQGLAFKKTAAVINIKRQSPVLKPYSGSGEFHFLRGVGITVKKKRWNMTLFSSYRKLSANLVIDSDSSSTTISAFLPSGYHRTEKEMADRNAAGQITGGSIFRLSSTNGHLSFNSIVHRFTYAVQKADEPYNLFAINGRLFINNSIDYSYTCKNFHFFGEVATDRNIATAQLHGVMIAADRKLDLAFLVRKISPRYHSLYGNAFTESSLPTNETGYYGGFTLRPSETVVLDAYVDIFRFPWLKYRVNAGSDGKEWLVSLTYRPGKRLHLFSRLKSSGKSQNQSGSGDPVDPIMFRTTRSWRTHTTIQVNRNFIFQQRFEWSSYGLPDNRREEGAMIFADIAYKPDFSRWKTRARMLFFNVDSYESRIYAYESVMPSMSSFPAFYGKGKRFLLNVNYRVSPHKAKWQLVASVGWTQTFYEDKEKTGSGLDEFYGSRRSNFILELAFNRD